MGGAPKARATDRPAPRRGPVARNRGATAALRPRNDIRRRPARPDPARSRPATEAPMSRSRTVTSPGDLPPRAWKNVALAVKDELAQDQVSLIAGGVAFYGLLALFPAITAMVAMAGLIVEPDTIVGAADTLAAALPSDAATIIIDQMKAVAGSDKGGLGLAAVLGILVAIYSASKGIDNMIRGLNVAFDETESRGFLQLKLTSLALTLSVLVGLLICLGFIAGLPALLSFLDGVPQLRDALTLLRWPALFVIGVGGILILYRYGPSRDPAKWRWLAPGALIACALWVLATLGFTLYVTYFGSYNETFGSLAGVIILLMWLWMSAFILLLGAEIDAELEDEADV
ncbi:YihY/virulence factor BrkB family protein [Rhodobacteraceae bacterium CCMM004]|nr:YihY/virulence factor BrkB family protein [Rhodobacteraceae bacterium CCMM004]